MTVALLIIIGLVLADIVAHEGEASVTYMIVMWIWQLAGDAKTDGDI